MYLLQTYIQFYAEFIIFSKLKHMCMYVFQTYIQFYAEFIIYSKLKHMYMYLLQTYIQFYAELSSTQNSNISVCTYFKLTFRFQNEFIINLCACTQKGAFLYKRRMAHYAEWFICA